MCSPPDLAEILRKIEDGICIFAADQRVSFMNEKASRILDTADAEFLLKIRKAATDHGARRFEHFHKAMNRWFEHQTYANADNGLTLISRDITSRHRLEEALRASEDRFRRVVDSKIIGVVVIESGYVTEANDIFLSMLGYTRADIITRRLHWRGMTPPEFDVLDEKALAEFESSGMFSPYQKEFFHVDGRRVPILIGGVDIPTHSNARQTLCLVLDLSETKRADERLRSILEGGKILASSLECEKTFPELAEFIVSKLADSCLIFVKQDEELLRMAAAHTLPLAIDLDLEDGIRRVMETSKPEMALVPSSRVLVPIVATEGVVGVLAATSARPQAFAAEDLSVFESFGRRAGIALQNARLFQETQNANRMKDEFVAIVSHELRTPLTPILGGVYMIRNDPQDKQIFRRALDLIERNAKTQVKIVDDLLDLSRAVSGKLRLNMEPVHLASVIQGAVETVRPASDAKRIQIDVRLNALSGIVIGDPDRLQQVVWNLLANSVKFTPEGGEVSVELVEESGSAEIRVSDSGIGIEPDFLPHVFDKFRQADTSRTRTHGGLGLGLTIVRHLVESHGGTVHAQSSGDEKGSTFVVRLPIRPAARLTGKSALAPPNPTHEIP